MKSCGEETVLSLFFLEKTFYDPKCDSSYLKEVRVYIICEHYLFRPTRGSCKSRSASKCQERLQGGGDSRRGEGRRLEARENSPRCEVTSSRPCAVCRKARDRNTALGRLGPKTHSKKKGSFVRSGHKPHGSLQAQAYGQAHTKARQGPRRTQK